MTDKKNETTEEKCHRDVPRCHRDVPRCHRDLPPLSSRPTGEISSSEHPPAERQGRGRHRDRSTAPDHGLKGA
ncbi:MAG: hypothetical protein WBN83_18130 [Desulfoprunum sp.]|uniref:hypothetical protein n=1 Tax=Desulfoprunum sp. TaxID=2020866 RepID=UPI003C783D49